MFLDVLELPLFIWSLSRLCTPFPGGSIAHLYSPNRSPTSLICICETSGNVPIQLLLIVSYLPFSLIMNSASELHNVNLGWCNLRVMFHSVCLSIFQALTFKITAREKCAQGKPSTTAYFAIFHKYRSPVRNTLSWDQRTKNHLVVAKARRLGLHHWY